MLALERSREEHTLLDASPWCSYVFLWPRGSLESYDVGRAADSRFRAALVELARGKTLGNTQPWLCGRVALSKWHLEHRE